MMGTESPEDREQARLGETLGEQAFTYDASRSPAVRKFTETVSAIVMRYLPVMQAAASGRLERLIVDTQSRRLEDIQSAAAELVEQLVDEIDDVDRAVIQ